MKKWHIIKDLHSGFVNTRAFDFTGKPMKGWVMVASGDHESDDRMLNWVKQGTDFAASLPSK